jgi:hypothetical protein
MIRSKIKSNYTGTFSKQDSVSFDTSLWSPTNGTINWSNYPLHIPYSETDVFHTQLTHSPAITGDIGWNVRIGKGGHIYYINIEGLGQIICPQRYMSPWNDDCMTTTVYSSDVVNDDTEMKIGNDSFANGYIHGSGMYIKPEMDSINNKPFYCPILKEEFNPNDRSYSIVNWGLVPKPNINRGDVLFYSRYRDLGNGVLEITFYCYNFGNRIYNFAETPWFAFRPSKFPNMIKGGVGGASTFELHNVDFADKDRIPQNRGWGAGTVNPQNPNSTTCALVWGSSSTGLGVNSGFVNRGERDMMLLAPSKSVFTMPYGTGIRYRRYLVFGKLANVPDICSKLNQHAFFETIEFSSTFSDEMPIYEDILEGNAILTTNPVGVSIANIHPIPVKNSLPLLLMKNKDNGDYFLSTDPYSVCGKKPFINPYPVGHVKYNEYQNKHIYQIYDGKTEWVSILGFVLPTSEVIGNNKYIKLSDIIAGKSISFIKGEGLDSSELSLINK